MAVCGPVVDDILQTDAYSRCLAASSGGMDVDDNGDLAIVHDRMDIFLNHYKVPMYLIASAKVTWVVSRYLEKKAWENGGVHRWFTHKWVNGYVSRLDIFTKVPVGKGTRPPTRLPTHIYVTKQQHRVRLCGSTPPATPRCLCLP